MSDRRYMIDPDSDSPFSTYLRPRRSRGPLIAAAVVILLLIAGGVWYFTRDESPPVVRPEAAMGATPPPALSLEPDEPLDLPALDTSDAFVRRLVAALSSHPQFARWLVTDDMVRRFVTTIAALANGSSPTPQLRFMAPTDSFRVREATGEATGEAVIDPASYGRYDVVAATFESLDTQGTARLIRGLHPLLVEAHQELGLPNRTFDGDLVRAIHNLENVNVPDTPPAIVHTNDGWIYADPALESRSAAAKHLMRMGPANARRVQTKLADIAEALGIPPQQ